MVRQRTSPVVATTEAKVLFLASGQAFPLSERPVTVIETHMSWVFLGRTRVLKMKKPVRFPFLDFTSLEQRYKNCEAELRLNRRLAADVYRRVVPLCSDTAGQFSIGGAGAAVEWLVEMRRLPSEEMLDARIRTHRLHKDDVRAVASVLARFYASARSEVEDGYAYPEYLRLESAVNREILMRPSLGVGGTRTENVLDAADGLLDHWNAEIRHRILEGWIVEGHGDLRPGHVCLIAPPTIFDCLEFNRNLRLLDPYDEVNFLGLECAMLGATWVRPLLLEVLGQEFGHPPAPGLAATYGAFRAVLRARLCIAHLLDELPQDTARWVRQSKRYLALARREVVRASG
jgi:aminoglycoside phosphotransferase family enzyme